MSSRYLFYYLVLAVLLQHLLGDFPLSFMAFPLNAVFAFVWLVALTLLYRQEKQSSFIRFMLAPKATVWSVALIIVGALGISFIPQFSVSWFFIAILFYVQTQLALITVRGFLRKGMTARWRFLLNHAGLWLALFGGFWGATDTETLRLPVYRDMPVREAYFEDGRVSYLTYEAKLLDFKVEYFANGVPSHYEAEVALGADTAVLKVNHPYARTWSEDIYLTGYDTEQGSESRYCILQIVREPWKGLIYLGVWMMIAGAFLLFIQGPKTERV